MHTYEVSFRMNGRLYRETVTTSDAIKARELIKARYPDATILGARQIS